MSVAGPVAIKIQEDPISFTVCLLLCIHVLPWAHKITVQIKEQANVQCCNKILNKIIHDFSFGFLVKIPRSYDRLRARGAFILKVQCLLRTSVQVDENMIDTVGEGAKIGQMCHTEVKRNVVKYRFLSFMDYEEEKT